MLFLTGEDRKRLYTAWDLIIDQFSDLAQQQAIKNGAGVTSFVMLPESTDRDHNCKMNWSARDSSFWNDILDSLNIRKAVSAIYDDKTMFIMHVTVPKVSNREEYFGNIRMFKFETKEEVNYTVNM